MRAVRGAQNLASKQQLAEVNPKFRAGPNELELEPELKILQPTNAEQLKQLTALVETLIRQKRDDPAWMNALRLWQMQITTGALSDQVKFQFVRRFYFWLLGRGTDDDVKRTIWGRGNAAVINREVALYIEQFSQRRLDYALQLSLLAMRIPTTLNGYYLYFKYIVNGKLKRAKANGGGSWWELSDDDYLQDFEMFQQEFDGGSGEPNYKDMIKPAAKRDGNQAPFDASRPYPSTRQENEANKLPTKKNADIVRDVLAQENDAPKEQLPEAMGTDEQGMNQPPVRGDPPNAQPLPVNLPAMGVMPSTADIGYAQIISEVRSLHSETLRRAPTSAQVFEAAQTAREAKIATEAVKGIKVPSSQEMAKALAPEFAKLAAAIENNKPTTAREIAAQILNGADPVTGVSLVRLVGQLTEETARVKELYKSGSKSTKRDDRAALERERSDAKQLTQQAAHAAQREQMAKDALAAEQVRSKKLEAYAEQQTTKVREYEAALRNAAEELARTKQYVAQANTFVGNLKQEATTAVNNLRQQGAATQQESAQWRSRFEQLAREYRETLQQNSAGLQQLLGERARSRQEVQYLASVIGEYENARQQREREDMEAEAQMAQREQDIKEVEEELMRQNLEEQAAEYERKITEKKLRAEMEMRKFMRRQADEAEEEAFTEAMRSREEPGKRKREKEEEAAAFQAAMESREEEAAKRPAVESREKPKPKEATEEEHRAHQEKINAAREEMNAVINAARDSLQQQFLIDVDPIKHDASGEEVFEEYFRLQLLQQVLFEARPSRDFIIEHLSGMRWRNYFQAGATQRARDVLGRFTTNH